MAHKTTFTGNVGPGRAVTAIVYNNLTEMHLYPDKKIMQVSNGVTVTDLDLNGVTTFTVSISSGQFSLTLS